MKGQHVKRSSGGLRGIVLAFGLVGLIAGCENSPPSNGDRWIRADGEVWRGGGEGSNTRTPTPEPTRTTETRPATTAPAAPAAPRSGTSNAVYYPTGHRDNAALLVERSYPAEVVANGPFEYSIKVTNVSPTTLDNVVVEEATPAGFTVSGSDPTGRAGNGGTTFDLGQLSPGQSKTITVRGTAGGAGTIESCARVYYTLPVCQTINVVSPALQITKTAPAEALICDVIPVKITVTNTGTGVAKNVVVRDELPAGLKTADGQTRLELPAGDLGSGQSKEFNLTLKADRPGRYANVASAQAASGLTARTGEVATVVRQPVLEIAKRGPERVFVGRPATFEITVSNRGDAPAANTVIEDPVPTGATFVSATDGGRVVGNTVQWNLGSLAAGASRTVSVTMNVPGIGSIRNVASAKATCANTVSAEAGTEFAGIPAILLEVVDNPDPVMVGDATTYTITATNQGSLTGTNIRITCNLEDEMTYVSSAGATTGTASGRTITFAPLATLAPGATATWTVVVRATGDGDVRFGVSMISDQLTRPVEETEATNFYR